MFSCDRYAAGLTLLFVLLATGLAAGQAPATQADSPVAETTITGAALSAEAVEAMIRSAESLEGEAKATVLEQLRTALADLQEAKGAREDIARLETQITQAPQALQQVQERREQLQASQAEPQAPADMTIEAAESELSAAEAALTQARQKLQEHKAEQERRSKQIINLPQEQQKALAEVQDLSDQLAGLSAPATADALTQAKKAALQAKRQLRQAQADLAGVQLRHINATKDLLGAQLALQGARVPQLEQAVAFWRKKTNERRLAQTLQLLRDAQQQREAYASQHPLLDRLTAENLELAEQLRGQESPSRRIVSTQQRLATTRARLARLNANYQDIESKINIVGLNESVGALLRELRRKLPDPEQLMYDIQATQQRLTDTQLAALEVRTRRIPLANTADQMLEELPPEARTVSLEAGLKNVLEKRGEILGQLETDYGTYARVLGELLQTTQELHDRTAEIGTYIDERVLWIRSVEPISFGTFERAAKGAAVVFAPGQWGEVLGGLWKGVASVPIRFAAWLVVVGAMVVRRRRGWRRIRELGEQGQERKPGAFLAALRALCWTVYVALLWPVLLWMLAWLLQQPTEVPAFVREVAAVLDETAGVVLAMLLLKHFCLTDGFAESHLRWKPARTTVIRRAMHIVLLFILPIAMLASLAGRIDGAAWQPSLGRLLLMVALLEATGLTAWLVRPDGPLLATDVFGGRLHRYRWVFFSVATAVPLLMLLLAAVGYLYTVREFAVIFRQQIVLLLGAVIVYQLMMRGVFLARRDMARRQIAEQRQAEAEGEKPEEQADRDLRVSLQQVSTTSMSVQRLALLLVIFAVVVGSLVIWKHVLPALGALDRITLWAMDAANPVSLRDLLGAILTVVIVFYVSRSLPGLLDAFVLQRFGMDSGKRYALTTVARYILVTVGVLLAADFIGIRWQNLQWIVAALGVGLGFGLQEIFANFISGLILLAERPIRVGDMVTVGDVTGKVSRIQIRATTIVDFDGKELIIPNKQFVTGQMINWSLSDRRARVVIPVGVAYGSNTQLAQDTLLEVARENPDVLDDPEPTAYFLGFGASSLDFQLRVFIDDTDKLFTVRHAMHMAIDQAFCEKDITIAFPQRDVHLFFDDREGLDRLAGRSRKPGDAS